MSLGVIPNNKYRMKTPPENEIGIYACIVILSISSIFFYLILKSSQSYQIFFLAGLYQVIMGFIFAFGAIKPHKCVLYRVIPIISGFFLYPFLGNAVPMYLAGMAIVGGLIFTGFGLLEYFKVF